MDLNKIVNKVKAKGIEVIAGSDRVINKFVNPHIEKYGKVIELSLKPENKEIYAKVLPAGEDEPIDLNIQDYKLLDDEESPSIVILKCTTSKEWLTALAQDFICGKEIPIPKDIFHWIKKVL
jgi:hypothetical protein